jgi:hypothetical protein
MYIGIHSITCQRIAQLFCLRAYVLLDPKLFLVCPQYLQGNVCTTTYNQDYILLAPLFISKPLAQPFPQLAIVHGGNAGTAGGFDKEKSIVGKLDRAHDGLGISHDDARQVILFAPLKRLLGNGRRPQTRGYAGDGGQSDQLASLYARIQTLGAHGLHDQHLGLLVPPVPAGLLFHALHDAAEQAAAAAVADDAVGAARRAAAAHAQGRQLRHQLLDNGGGALPEVRVVKGRDVDAGGVGGQQVPAQVRVGLGPVGADLDDLGAQEAELANHKVGRAGGHDNGGGLAQGRGRRRAGQSGVAARGAVKVHVAALVALYGAQHHVAHAALLEGARGLEVF